MREGSSESRRSFLGAAAKAGGLAAAASGAALLLSRRARQPDVQAPGFDKSYTVPPVPSLPEMAVMRAAAANAAVRLAVDALGGMRRFVSRGDIVVLKPNMAWDRAPAQAANTSPEAISEVARLCFEAGARKVLVADVPINEPRRAAERSGIAGAARAAGADIVFPADGAFREVDLRGEVLRVWPVFRPLLEADKVINIAAAKHHSLTGVTLGLKNLYGILGGERRRLHQRIHESLADLAVFLRPTLTVLDAWRILVRNGPAGGNLEDVELRKTIIAGTDAVAVDAFAASSLFGLEAAQLPYLEMAALRGAGHVDFRRVRTVSGG